MKLTDISKDTNPEINGVVKYRYVKIGENNYERRLNPAYWEAEANREWERQQKIRERNYQDWKQRNS